MISFRGLANMGDCGTILLRSGAQPMSQSQYHEIATVLNSLPNTLHDPNDEPKFYMVYVEGGNAPAHRHPTLAAAITEARRLTLDVKRKAYVLETVGSLKVESAPVRWTTTKTPATQEL